MMLSFPQAIRATQKSTGSFNATAGVANSAAQQTGEAQRILVVDDNTDAPESLTELLRCKAMTRGWSTTASQPASSCVVPG